MKVFIQGCNHNESVPGGDDEAGNDGDVVDKGSDDGLGVL